MEKLKEALKDEAERIFEDCLFTSKAQYNAADRWSYINLWLGIPATILAATSGVLTFVSTSCPQNTQCFTAPIWLPGILAVITGVLTALITFLNPSERKSLHRNAAGQYHALRNQARIFKEIQLVQYESKNNEKLQDILISLANKRDDLNQNSPMCSDKDFQKARKGIEQGESKYQVDEAKKHDCE